MPRIKLITGDYDGAALTSYYNSGDTANANLLRNLSGTGLAFVESSDFDFETQARGYVQCDKSASLTFRVNNASEFLTADYDGSAEGSDYWVSFWVRGVVLEGEAPLTNQSSTLLAFTNSSTTLQTRIVTRADDSTDGFSFGFATASLSGHANRAFQVSGTATNTNFPLLAWNTWHQVTLHFRRGAASGAAGLAQIFLNGRLVSQSTGFDGTPDQLNYGQSTDRNLVLPAWTNVRWQLAGPIESWNGRDMPLRPLYQRNGAACPVNKDFRTFGHKASAAIPAQGNDFESSGTGTVAQTTYSSAGTAPYRGRLILSGDGDTPIVSTIENLGGPYYRNGWQTVAFAEIVVPNGCTSKIELMNAANDAAVLTLNITSGELRQDSTKVLDWSMPGSPSDTNQVRYTLFVHLGANGQAAVTLFSHLANIHSALGAWGAALPSGWTPQALGKLRFTATTTARSVELGQVGIGYEFDVFGIDSQTSNEVSSSIQQLRHPSGYARGFDILQDRTSIPGGNWPGRRYGLRRQFGFAVFGRTGLRREWYTSYVLPGLSHARNLRFLLPDLGSINDILQIGSNQQAKAEQLIDELKEFLDVVLPNGNRVWLTTMLTRDRTGIPNATYTANRLAGIGIVNDLLRANIAKWNTAGRITFSDIHADYAHHRSEYQTGDTFWADDTHPAGTSTAWRDTGYTDAARRMVEIATVPRVHAAAQRNRSTPGLARRLSRSLLGR